MLEGSQELAHTCRFGIILFVEFISQLVGYLFLEFTTKLGRVVNVSLHSLCWAQSKDRWLKWRKTLLCNHWAKWLISSSSRSGGILTSS
jgi:hypothetical protein